MQIPTNLVFSVLLQKTQLLVEQCEAIKRPANLGKAIYHISLPRLNILLNRRKSNILTKTETAESGK